MYSNGGGGILLHPPSNCPLGPRNRPNRMTLKVEIYTLPSIDWLTGLFPLTWEREVESLKGRRIEREREGTRKGGEKGMSKNTTRVEECR